MFQNFGMGAKGYNNGYMEAIAYIPHPYSSSSILYCIHGCIQYGQIMWSTKEKNIVK